MKKLGLFLGFLWCLTGCASLYGPDSYNGGYSQTQIDRNTFRVNFEGNNATDSATVENYMLYRSAELTMQYGYDYFVMIDNRIEANNQYYQTPGSYMGSADINGPFVNSYGTYFPGQVYNAQNYNAFAIVKMFKGKKPKGLLNAYNAIEVLEYMQPVIQR